MKNDIVDCATYYYLPWRWLWAIALTAGGGQLIVLSRPVFGIFMLVLAALALSCRYGIRINIAEKTWFDYFSVLGIKNGETKSYSVIDYVFIKTNKVSQTMNSLATSKTFRKEVFDAYIKFDGNEKVFLVSDEKKPRVMSLLTRLAQPLSVNIIDYSLEEGVAE